MSQTLFTSYSRHILCPKCHKYLAAGQEVDVELRGMETFALDDVEKEWHPKDVIGISFEWKDIIVTHSSCA